MIRAYRYPRRYDYAMAQPDNIDEAHFDGISPKIVPMHQTGSYQKPQKGFDESYFQTLFVRNIVKPMEKLLGIRLDLDDIILGVLIVFLFLEESRDELLLIALAFVLITGRE